MINDLRKSIGRSLQDARKKKYRSAKAFAEAIGIEVGTYTAYEQGVNPFTAEQAWLFADQLGITIDELIGRNAQFDIDDESKTLLERYKNLSYQARRSINEQIELQELKSAKEKMPNHRIQKAEIA